MRIRYEYVLIIVSIISKKGKQKPIKCSNNLPENNISTFNNLYLSYFLYMLQGYDANDIIAI